MKNYNTLSRDIYTAKRSILNFSSKLSEGMQKPNRKFLMDMLFGLAKGKSVLLSDIALALEESIDPIQTIKRLSSRLEEFHEEEQLLANYKKITQSQLKSGDNLVIVDTSEIIKPYSNKLEALGQVRDGSTGKIEKGYWTTNMIAVGKKTKHPLPLYSHLYSSVEEEFISENEETYKGLDHVRDILGDKKATFIMDRDYDNVKIMKKVLSQNDDFIIRLKKNRHLIYQNKKLSVRGLALRRKGKINFRSEIKGNVYDLKVSHITVEIPSLKGQKLTMVVVYGYGKDPMVLLTNKQAKKKDEVLSILKAYITRWRIEEMFRVQKQEFGLEGIRVRSLKRLNLLFFLVSTMITFMTLKIEKKNGFFHAIIERARGLKAKNQIKMFLYRFSAGMKAILEKDTHGIQHYKYIEKVHDTKQLELELAL
ncbi:transposase [Virgibacillus pantothenticus]|uniref:transposase n=1 Tax=Virgibacillus pantothenticus TaxID=1473 RepID=UPI003D27ACEB